MRFILGFVFLLFTTNAIIMNNDLNIEHDKECLKLNLYHEARGESARGILEVMRVTLARTLSPDFPNTVCKVVRQKNQFEWFGDHINDYKIKDMKSWHHIDNLVESYYNGKLKLDINSDVLYYHSGKRTKFFKKLVLAYKIDNHSFYKEKHR